MAYAEEHSYEEMISALQKFLSGLEEQCAVMTTAGEDCVDNTEEDQAAVKADAKLKTCVAGIRANFETIQQVIAKLQEELEELRRTKEKANFDYD